MNEGESRRRMHIRIAGVAIRRMRIAQEPILKESPRKRKAEPEANAPATTEAPAPAETAVTQPEVPADVNA